MEALYLFSNKSPVQVLQNIDDLKGRLACSTWGYSDLRSDIGNTGFPCSGRIVICSTQRKFLVVYINDHVPPPTSTYFSSQLLRYYTPAWRGLLFAAMGKPLFFINHGALINLGTYDRTWQNGTKEVRTKYTNVLVNMILPNWSVVAHGRLLDLASRKGDYAGRCPHRQVPSNRPSCLLSAWYRNRPESLLSLCWRCGNIAITWINLQILCRYHRKLSRYAFSIPVNVDQHHSGNL